VLRDDPEGKYLFTTLNLDKNRQPSHFRSLHIPKNYMWLQEFDYEEYKELYTGKIPDLFTHNPYKICIINALKDILMN